MKKILIASLIAVFCCAGLASQAMAAKHTFAVTHDSPEDTVTHLMTVKFAELLQEKSKGQFVAQVYPSGQLGSDKELTQSCQAGDIAFVLQATAPQFNFVPELAVFDIPMLFKDLKVAREALDGFQPYIGKFYEKAGFKILGYGDQGFREMSSNKNIKQIDDFKGIKIRTMENKYHMAFWRALGANPTPLPFGEVYLSLQQGTIVAQENPLEVLVAAKLYEQQKYAVLTRHILHSITIIMSKQVYDGLTPEDQAVVNAVARETVLYGRAQADARMQNRYDILTSNKTELVEITPELRAIMQERSAPIQKEISDAIGAEVVEALVKEIEKASK